MKKYFKGLFTFIFLGLILIPVLVRATESKVVNSVDLVFDRGNAIFYDIISVKDFNDSLIANSRTTTEGLNVLGHANVGVYQWDGNETYTHIQFDSEELLGSTQKYAFFYSVQADKDHEFVDSVKALGASAEKRISELEDFTVTFNGEIKDNIYVGYSEPWKCVLLFIPIGEADEGHKITFNTNGGTEVPVSYVRQGGFLPPEKWPEVTREGYEFAAWYKDSGLSQIFEPTDPINGDLILYAKWNKAADVEIESVKINGIVPPVADNTPEVKNLIIEPVGVELINAFWTFEDTGEEMKSTDKFVEKQRYHLHVHFRAKDGYVIPEGFSEEKIAFDNEGLKAEYIKEREEVEIYYEASAATTSEENVPSTDPINEENSTIIDLKELNEVKATGTTITFSWNKNPDAKGYYVYRKNGKKWKKITTIKNNNTTSYTNKKLKSGTSYTYKVVSYTTTKKKKKTISVNLVTTNTITINTSPVAPKPSIKGSNYESVKIGYKKVKGASRYEIYRSTSKKGTYTKVGESTGTTYNDTGIKTGTTYYYKVKACNKYCSGYSKVISKKPSLGKQSLKVSSPSKGQVLVKPSIVAGEDGYILQMSTKKSKGFKEVANLDVATKEFLDEGYKSKKTYYYRARVYRVVDGKTIYGSWSKVVKVKVK